MEKLIGDAHRELSQELLGLAAAYQRAVQLAAANYQQGLLEAQLRFEERLNSAVESLTEQVKEIYR